MNPTLKLLARDLTKEFPRSPRETLGGYVLACRTLDKCRAVCAGTEGEYHFDCPLDQMFLEFSGIDAADFRKQVESGATDDEMDAWVRENAKQQEPIEVIKWNNHLRYLRISEMDDKLQEFLEGYIEEYVPKHRPVYVWFDVYDLEEGRL